MGEGEVEELLTERGADAAAVTEEDRELGALLSGRHGTAPSIDGIDLDAMLFMAVQGGHTRTVERLLNAGARVDGDPDPDGVPLGQAAWRRYPDIVRLLVSRGAARSSSTAATRSAPPCTGRGTAITPRAAPRCRPWPRSRAPYAGIVRFLLDAGTPVPERRWEDAPPPAEMIGDLLTETGA